MRSANPDTDTSRAEKLAQEAVARMQSNKEIIESINNGSLVPPRGIRFLERCSKGSLSRSPWLVRHSHDAARELLGEFIANCSTIEEAIEARDIAEAQLPLEFTEP